MSKVINNWVLTDTLSLQQCTDGWWLYDKQTGMNIAMRSANERDAFVNALTFYQKQYRNYRECYESLEQSVDNFINIVRPKDESD